MDIASICCNSLLQQFARMTEEIVNTTGVQAYLGRTSERDRIRQGIGVRSAVLQRDIPSIYATLQRRKTMVHIGRSCVT